MSLLGIDLGGTKLGMAVFTTSGAILHKEQLLLNGREGAAVGELISSSIRSCITGDAFKSDPVQAVGISVPGISRRNGMVWAPNIPGWDDYPLLAEASRACGDIPIRIESDRACCILGEVWQGNARNCRNAIFLAVGTGIGAGILADGRILRGAGDISGAIGWMSFGGLFEDKYKRCGHFEYYASGNGIARQAAEMLQQRPDYRGALRNKPAGEITCHDVFAAYDSNDPIAEAVIRGCIVYWGMAIANLVSLFNSEKLILGGGVFGPASRFIPAIGIEAQKWAQPLGFREASIEAAALGGEAGVYGAAYTALQLLATDNHKTLPGNVQ